MVPKDHALLGGTKDALCNAIQDGLVNESGTFKPTVLQSQDDEVVAAHLGLTMEEWENFPKRDAFIEASTVTAL